MLVIILNGIQMYVERAIYVTVFFYFLLGNSIFLLIENDQTSPWGDWIIWHIGNEIYSKTYIGNYCYNNDKTILQPNLFWKQTITRIGFHEAQQIITRVCIEVDRQCFNVSSVHGSLDRMNITSVRRLCWWYVQTWSPDRRSSVICLLGRDDELFLTVTTTALARFSIWLALRDTLRNKREIIPKKLRW